MKKLLLTTGIVISMLPVSARIVTSQNNGNATNPFTWNCICIPTNGDTIIINHAVTLDIDYAFTAGGIQINAGGSLTGNAPNRIFGVSGGFFLNNGTLNMAWVYHNGGTFTNNATMIIGRSMGVDLAVTTINTGSITITDTMAINTPSAFQNFGTMTCPVFLNAGSYSNSGTTTCTNFWNSGTVMHTGGAMNVNMDLFNSGNITLNAATTITQDIFNSENITVNYFMSARSLYTGDSIQLTAFFTNNATISLSQDLWNSEDLTGSGHFCVGDSTVNFGNVTGTLDICDLNGGTWDFNVGTVAGTVTYCSTSCTIGIPEVPRGTLSIVPNPATDFVNVQLTETLPAIIQIIDVTGKVVFEGEFQSQAQFDISALAAGVYSILISTEQNVYTDKMVVE